MIRSTFLRTLLGLPAALSVPLTPVDDYRPAGYINADDDWRLDVKAIRLNGELIEDATELNDIEGWITRRIQVGRAARQERVYGTVRVEWFTHEELEAKALERDGRDGWTEVPGFDSAGNPISFQKGGGVVETWPTVPGAESVEFTIAHAPAAGGVAIVREG